MISLVCSVHDLVLYVGCGWCLDDIKNENTELKKQLGEARSVIEFYANEEYPFNEGPIFLNKRARTYLEKYPKREESEQ